MAGRYDYDHEADDDRPVDPPYPWPQLIALAAVLTVVSLVSVGLTVAIGAAVVTILAVRHNVRKMR
jgi:hypothetical protein